MSDESVAITNDVVRVDDEGRVTLIGLGNPIKISDVVSVQLSAANQLNRSSAEALRVHDNATAALIFTGDTADSRPAIYRVYITLPPFGPTDITNDVITSGGRAISWKRGSSSGGPKNLMADIGTMEFWLRNDARPGKPKGYYSPYHAACLPGFTRGITVELIAVTTSGTPYPLWKGTIRKISPLSGQYGMQQTYCYASDAMDDFADSNAKTLTAQIGKTEVELLQAVIATLPISAQPTATSYGTALDVYDYAFYDMGGKPPSVRSLLDQIMQNARGRLFIAGDGTLTYVNRHSLSSRTSAFTFNNTFQDIVVADDLQDVFNRVQITQHPKRPTAAGLAAAPTVALFSDTSPIAIEQDQTLTLWADYRDATNTQKLLGAASVVTPLVATTDYTANASADGSGSNMTSTLDASATVGFASSVKFVFTNNAQSTAYITFRQIRGKGLYDDAPITVESYTPKDYGDRLLELDLKFISDSGTAQDLADFINASFNDPSNQAREIRIVPFQSSALLTQSLTREIGDILTASEVQTGLSDATLMIVGMHSEITSDVVQHWWTVIPQLVQQAWIFDQSRFDVDLIFGYA